MNNIQEKFKKRKRNQIIVFIIFAIIMYGCLNQLNLIGDTGHKYSIVIMIVAVAMTTGFSIFTFMNWRCPNCNKLLGRFVSNGRFIKFCKSCGKELV